MSLFTECVLVTAGCEGMVELCVTSVVSGCCIVVVAGGGGAGKALKSAVSKRSVERPFLQFVQRKTGQHRVDAS